MLSRRDYRPLPTLGAALDRHWPEPDLLSVEALQTALLLL
jgi:hypothetical protein